jgi:hypothetical protein
MNLRLLNTTFSNSDGNLSLMGLCRVTHPLQQTSMTSMKGDGLAYIYIGENEVIGANYAVTTPFF